MSSVAATSTPLVAGSTAAELLRLLAFDDAFRSRLVADPRAALAELGITVGVSATPASVELPAKAVAASALDAANERRVLDDDGGTVFHFFFC